VRASGYAAYGPEPVLSWPCYGLGLASMSGGRGASRRPSPTTKVPLGEVTVRRGDQVQATDGDTGCVEGLVIDHSDRHATHARGP
jgi:hypothetical protein